jgi:cytoskeleton protein RodZ
MGRPRGLYRAPEPGHDRGARSAVAQGMLGSKTEPTDQVDPAEALMREVGAQLRQVRLERGEDLEQVAQYLRIRANYLVGIEQGDMSVMPGQTYALGFLRSYADHLGFDGDDLVGQIKSTVADLTGRTRLRLRTPLPESRLPKAPILVLSLAAIAGIYVGWTYLDRSGRIAIETVAEVPEQIRSLAPDPLPDDGSALWGAGAAATDQGSTSSADSELMGAATAATGDTSPPAAPTVPSRRVDDMVPQVSSSAGEAALDVSGRRAGEVTEPASTAALETSPSDTADTSAPTADAVDPPRPTEPSEPEAAPWEPGAGPAAASVETEVAVVAVPDPSADGAGVTGSQAGARPPTEASPDQAARPSPDEVIALLSARTDGEGGTPQIYESENADARVILHALDYSWIQITSTDGDYLRARTLQPGDVLLVPNRDDLLLWTGNAGGLQVIVDGVPVPPLGAEGAVVRKVSLDPVHLGGEGG